MLIIKKNNRVIQYDPIKRKKTIKQKNKKKQKQNNRAIQQIIIKQKEITELL